MPSQPKQKTPPVVPVNVDDSTGSKKPAQKRQKTSSTTEVEVSSTPTPTPTPTRTRASKAVTDAVPNPDAATGAAATGAAATDATTTVTKPKAPRGSKAKSAVDGGVANPDAGSSASASASASSVNSGEVSANPDGSSAAVPPNAETKISDMSDAFLQKINDVCHSVTHLKKDFQVLEKNFSKELKAIQKLSTKKRQRSTNRQPSGFVKPTRISDELAVFLGKPLGTEMARTEVTKELSSYIDANKLKDSLNGRIIHADRKLLNLLHIESDTPLTFFNLQKFMRNHFATAASIAAEAAAAAAAASANANDSSSGSVSVAN